MLAQIQVFPLETSLSVTSQLPHLRYWRGNVMFERVIFVCMMFVLVMFVCVCMCYLWVVDTREENRIRFDSRRRRWPVAAFLPDIEEQKAIVHAFWHIQRSVESCSKSVHVISRQLGGLEIDERSFENAVASAQTEQLSTYTHTHMTHTKCAGLTVAEIRTVWRWCENWSKSDWIWFNLDKTPLLFVSPPSQIPNPTNGQLHPDKQTCTD